MLGFWASLNADINLLKQDIIILILKKLDKVNTNWIFTPMVITNSSQHYSHKGERRTKQKHLEWPIQLKESNLKKQNMYSYVHDLNDSFCLIFAFNCICWISFISLVHSPKPRQGFVKFLFYCLSLCFSPAKSIDIGKN